MTKNDYLRMQDEHRAYLLKTVKPTLMITHNFGGFNKAHTAISLMTLFYNMVQAAEYGRDWAHDFDRTFPVAYGFREHPHSNPHYHVLLRAPKELGATIIQKGPKLWLRNVRRGQLDVQSIPVGKPDPIVYCTKNLTHETAFDDMFVYNDRRAV